MYKRQVYNNKQEVVINSIYPNPVQNIFKLVVTAKSSKKVYAKIFNEFGELEYNENIILVTGLNNININVVNLKIGTHYLVIGELDKRLQEITFIKY